MNLSNRSDKTPTLILIHGLPLSLKSTLAADLSGMLQCGWVGTGFFGMGNFQGTEIEFTSARDRRYKACSQIVEAYIHAGWSVIVEGNFSLARWRLPILKLCRDNKIPLVTIRCWCSHSEEIVRRFSRRRKTPFALDRDANADAYHKEEKQEMSINEDEFLGLEDFLQLDLDTGSWNLRVVREQSSRSSFVKSCIDSWIDYKKTNYD